MCKHQTIIRDYCGHQLFCQILEPYSLAVAVISQAGGCGVYLKRDIELSVNIYWPGSFRTDGFLKQYRKLTMLLL